MRHLIDTYIRAEESEKVSAFDDLSLIQLIVERGPDAVEALPEGIRKDRKAVAETIENNVRRLIIDESPVNPKYYEKMSELLDALIAQRRQEALEYRKYLAELIELTRRVKKGPAGGTYSESVDTPARRALYDNLGNDRALALAMDAAVLAKRQDGWRTNPFKLKKVRYAIQGALQNAGTPEGATAHGSGGGAAAPADGSHPYAIPHDGPAREALLDRLLELVKNQREY